MSFLTFRPIEQWPGTLRAEEERKPHPFQVNWRMTLLNLQAELRAIDTDPDTVVLQLAVEERELRLNGALRARVKPSHPGVILSFTCAQGELSFPCDTFTHRSYQKLEGWQSNVRAIALSLEALRRVDRYGVTNTGQQYRGWQALPPGTPMPAAKMGLDDAAKVLYEAATPESYESSPDEIKNRWSVAHLAWRTAVKKHHPDHGGDPSVFRHVQQAYDVLRAHHGQ